jgi:flagellum-specific ATP synthase
MMARLIERAGRFSTGSITGFYTVLMEGDDQQDPLVDTARSLLDGHVVLSRNLALHNHYPAISVLDSLSRLMPAICSPQQIEKAGMVRMLLSAYARAEDLIRIGAYKPGTDVLLDRAIAALPAINEFLCQNPTEMPLPAETYRRMLALST